MDWLKMAARARALSRHGPEVSRPRRRRDDAADRREALRRAGSTIPDEGHVDPSGVTHAYAKAARMQGAEIELRTRVVELRRARRHLGRRHRARARPRRACRQRRRPVGARGRAHGRARAAGARHGAPCTSSPRTCPRSRREPKVEVMHTVDFDGEIYLRQERGGMLIGTYEQAGGPWSPKHDALGLRPWSCCPSRPRPHRALARGRVRAFPGLPEQAGIKQGHQRAFTFAPDGNPLVGPVRGLPNYWVACGVMAGLQPGRRRRAGARRTG